MKKHLKGFLPGFITALLLVGLIGGAAAVATQKQALLNYSNIRVTLDGEIVYLHDAKGLYIDIFAIDGTTYLPIRDMAEVFGMGVNWNAKDNRVELTSPKTTIGPFYDKTIIPRFDFIIGEKSLYYQSADLDGDGSGIQSYSYSLSLSENGDFDALKKLYSDMLSKVGYKQTFSGKIGTGPFFVYTNSKEKYELTVGANDIGSEDARVTIFVKPTGGSSSSSSSSSSGGNSSSSGGNSSTDNRAAYESELATLDAALATAQVDIEAQYRQAYLDYKQDFRTSGGDFMAESQKAAVEARYQGARFKVDEFANSIQALYDADVATLKAKYGY